MVKLSTTDSGFIGKVCPHRRPRRELGVSSCEGIARKYYYPGRPLKIQAGSYILLASEHCDKVDYKIIIL